VTDDALQAAIDAIDAAHAATKAAQAAQAAANGSNGSSLPDGRTGEQVGSWRVYKLPAGDFRDGDPVMLLVPEDEQEAAYRGVNGVVCQVDDGMVTIRYVTEVTVQPEQVGLIVSPTGVAP
jgi:hypothetical protein